jgi:hypothetical protein
MRTLSDVTVHLPHLGTLEPARLACYQRQAHYRFGDRRQASRAFPRYVLLVYFRCVSADEQATSGSLSTTPSSP